MHNHSPPATNRWRRKTPFSLLRSTPPLIAILLPTLLLLSFLLHPSARLRSPFTNETLENNGGVRCGVGGEERFLFYAPHSGFSNQLSEFRNAIAFATILNRTLVVPPVLDHHAVALGSCPKFRVTAPADLRAQVFDHAIDLLRSGRYVSMADIIDVQSLLSSQKVRMVDFRLFISNWCGLNMKPPCFVEPPLHEKLKSCRSLLSGLDGNAQNCTYAVDDDCRTTVWTYNQNQDGIIDSFQPDEELRRKKGISYVRRRRDVYKAFGSGSKAEMATILTFGTLFTSPYRGSELYIDIHKGNADHQIQALLEKIESMRFVPEIVDAGKDYSRDTIRGPYLCAQLRLLDGQFKNHWKTTFAALRQKLISVKMQQKQSNIIGPINIFIMTDLPSLNWTGTYLAELARDSHSFNVHFLTENDPFVLKTAENVMAAQHGLHISNLMKNIEMKGGMRNCNLKLPDILLFLEESICSCADLGFVGTAGSTIADSIELMRKNRVCSS